MVYQDKLIVQTPEEEQVKVRRFLRFVCVSCINVRSENARWLLFALVFLKGNLFMFSCPILFMSSVTLHSLSFHVVFMTLLSSCHHVNHVNHVWVV